VAQGQDTQDKTGRGPDAGNVSPADIREKLEELQGAAADMVDRKSAAALVGTLLGAAVAMTVAYMAGRRSCP
jgi:hypothetical protein